MSQNDFTIANQGFPAFRADLNSALQALASNNSGATEPSTMFANMWWYDSANNIMYIRNEDNDAWIKFAELDQVNDKFVLSGTLQLDDGTVSAPALTFNSDTNTGIYRGGTDILKFVTAGTDAITIDASQGVTLAGKLDVSSGTIKLDGNHPVGSNNVALGDTALNSNVSGQENTAIGQASLYTNTGSFNTAVGRQALYYNTGANNVAVGVNALVNNTTASNNTAVGYLALNANTTGGANTAVGSNALYSNTTALNNTAVGNASLYLNTTGTNLLAVGETALYNNTTGTNNTALGRQALFSNNTGTQNTAVGFACLYSNTGGYNNTAVGYQALLSSVTAERNTAVGRQALKSSTGSYNTAIGDLALSENTSGIKNIAVGIAMQSNTTGSNNVASGADSLKLNTTGSSNVAIGDSALLSNTTADDNTAVGYLALTSNTTSTGNTGLGKYALGGNTTGHTNTGIGWHAFQSVTTGTLNTAIGYLAGQVLTTGSGNIHIGKSTSASAAGVNSELVFGNSLTGKGDTTCYIQGQVYNSSNTSAWQTVSDRRIKKNIVDNTTGLDAINQVQVRNFEYRTQDEIVDFDNPKSAVVNKQGIQLGVIAQEIQTVLPDMVKEESTGVLSVNPDNMTWYLVNAVKELSAQITELQSEIATLKGE